MLKIIFIIIIFIFSKILIILHKCQTKNNVNIDVIVYDLIKFIKFYKLNIKLNIYLIMLTYKKVLK